MILAAASISACETPQVDVIASQVVDRACPSTASQPSVCTCRYAALISPCSIRDF